MKKNRSVTFIVTALNEEKNITRCLSELHTYLTSKFEHFQIYFVDDGSLDQTFNFSQKLNLSNLKTFKNEINLGSGGSIKKVLPLIETDFFCWFPSDMEFHPNVLEKAFDDFDTSDIIVTYADNAKIVRTPFRFYLSSLFTLIINCFFNHRIKYYNGITFYRTSLFQKIHVESNRFFFHAELLLRALAKKPITSQVAIKLSPRQHGKSGAIKIKNLLDVVHCFFNCIWELKIKNTLKES